MKRSAIVLLFITSFLLAQDTTKPKLVVIISVDQMKEEYLDRFRGDFVGGFKRMLEGGLLFDNATLNYATSETGPGHASLGTGRYPSGSGILSNEWFDTKLNRQVNCVEDSSSKPVSGEGGYRSSKNLAVNGLGDWLKQASPNSKVIGLSAKDRSAILTTGKKPDAAYWYSRTTGHMGSSTAYMDSLPEWVKAFNANDWIRKFLPVTWTQLQPDSLYPGPDAFEGEMRWDDTTAFPHYFRPDKRKDQILTSPFADQMLLDFARAAIAGERLGQREATDLLCIGLSATDYIGHEFGPNSHEMRDNLLRLDLVLGGFIADLETAVGRGNVLIALGADHAVMPLPEYLSSVQFKPSRRADWKSTVGTAIDSLNKALQKKFKTTEPMVRNEGFINYAMAKKKGVAAVTLEGQVRTALIKTGIVADVFFRSELLSKRTKSRKFLQQFRNSYYAPRGEDFQILFKEWMLVASKKTGTSHGTPYEYDTHIPILFWGKHFTSNRSETPVHSVDVAPTLAALLGIPVPKNLDGNAIGEVLR